MIAVSVVRPAITMSAPVSSAAWICSAPARATILVQLVSNAAEISSTGLKGVTRPAAKAATIFPLSWPLFRTAIFSRSPVSAAISRVMSSSQSTASSAPLVPAVPITKGTPASARAAMMSAHSAFTDPRAYFDVPVPK